MEVVFSGSSTGSKFKMALLCLLEVPRNPFQLPLELWLPRLLGLSLLFWLFVIVFGHIDCAGFEVGRFKLLFLALVTTHTNIFTLSKL